ncbi:MAG: hypothetical protein MJE66_09210 [Proteobacteria bacterium]|nr:hypothetical protein [Pseudomonadota bacterium]
MATVDGAKAAAAPMTFEIAVLKTLQNQQQRDGQAAVKLIQNAQQAFELANVDPAKGRQVNLVA